MDRIKSLSEKVMERHENKFGKDFAKNKKELEAISIIRSKGLKNEIAGYITKTINRNIEEQKKREQDERDSKKQAEKQSKKSQESDNSKDTMDTTEASSADSVPDSSEVSN